MKGFLNKFLVYKRSDGLLNAVIYVLKTILNVVYINSTTVFLRCDKPSVELKDGTDIRVYDDARLIRQLAFERLQLLDCDEKIENGHKLYVGFVDGRPVSYSWTAVGRYKVLYVGHIDLDNQEYWIGPTFVLNDYRGRGLNKAGINRQIHDVDGVCFTSVNSGNKPSLHSFLSLGFKEIGRVTYKKFLFFSSVDIEGAELKGKIHVK